MLAGGTPPVALRLGLAMLAIQASVGALNDAHDAAGDAVSKPSKPIPAGLASRTQALGMAGLGLAIGLALAAPSGLAAVAIASAGAACGYAYDLWLKPTALSWLPLAVALPLLPLFAWVGVGAVVLPSYVALLGLAVLAGASLAISNALVDIEGDRATGTRTVVAWLGAATARRVHELVLGAAIIGASWLVIATGSVGPWTVAMVAGVALIVIGASRLQGPAATRAALGWELETLGVGLLGLGCLASITALPR